MTDITRIISDLERQRTAIESAISALRDIAESGADRAQESASTRRKNAPIATKKKRQMSQEGRQRIIDAAKKRWATKRAALKRQASATKASKKQQPTA